MAMIDALGESLNVELKMGQCGWCEWLIIHGEDVFHIDLSYVFDPFKDMVFWLNNVNQARNPYDLVIDEEANHFVTLSSYAKNEHEIVVTLVEDYLYKVTQRMSVCVNRKLFCETLQNEIVRFFKDDYDPFQWELQRKVGLRAWVLDYFSQTKDEDKNSE